VRLTGSRIEEAAMTHRIRPLAATAALLILLTACAAASGSTGSAASCTAQLTFRGQAYAGSSLRTHPPYTRIARIEVAHMHVIGTGVIPACRDTNHSTDQDQSVPVARIDGVDPGIAIATYPDGGVFVHGLTLPVISTVLKSARGIRWDYSS
jgi:Family of unknown function (DUF6281)